MIVVVLKFKVKPNQTDIFIDNWKQLTEFIYENENSLGSRLHKESAPVFIAYAQWLDRGTLHNPNSQLPSEALLVRQRMRDACESVDLLRQISL